MWSSRSQQLVVVDVPEKISFAKRLEGKENVT